MTRSWRQWLAGGGLSICDQALFSGTNFAIQIALARFLTLEDYGAFGIAFSIYLFAMGVFMAFTVEPLAIILAGRGHGECRKYLSHILFVLLLVSAIPGTLLVAVMLVTTVTAADTRALAIAAAATLPPLLVHWGARRACYQLGRPSTAFVSTVAYSLVAGAAFTVSYRQGTLSVETGFWTMALGAIAAIGVACTMLRLIPLPPGRNRWKPMANEHWRHGRWILGSSVVYWFLTWGIIPLIGSVFGTAAAGAFRAFANLVVPLAQGIAALNTYLAPTAAHGFHAQGDAYLRKFASIATPLFLFMGVVYAVILIADPNSLLGLIYGPGRYAGYVWMIYPFAAWAVLEAARPGIGVALFSAGKTQELFLATSYAASLTAVAAAGCVLRDDVHAAVWLYPLANGLLASFVLVAFLRRRTG